MTDIDMKLYKMSHNMNNIKSDMTDINSNMNGMSTD